MYCFSSKIHQFISLLSPTLTSLLDYPAKLNFIKLKKTLSRKCLVLMTTLVWNWSPRTFPSKSKNQVKMKASSALMLMLYQSILPRLLLSRILVITAYKFCLAKRIPE